MKLRSAAWAGIVLVLMATSCSRSTPGKTPSNEAQQTAQTTPQPSPEQSASEQQAAPPPAATPVPSRKKATTAKTEAKAENLPKEAVAPTPLPPPPPLVVPANTALAVRINEAIDSKNNKAGDQFTGVIAQPVTVGGRTAIPAGAAVAGHVAQAQQGGKIKGSSGLGLELVAIKVNGVSYPIKTTAYTAQGKGKGKRTAKFGAGGAAAGALIGGIAGGGKGALIGSAVGGGAGVAGSAMTGNEGISIPAETVVQFSLSHALTINQGSAHAPSGNTPGQGSDLPPAGAPGQEANPAPGTAPASGGNPPSSAPTPPVNRNL